MKDRSDKKHENSKYYITAGILGISLIALLLIAYAPFSPWSYWWEEGEGAVPTIGLSTFDLYSKTDGEKVSGLEYIELYTPKSSAVFEDWADIRDITVNFEMETRKLANALSFDLRDVDYAWAKLCPAGYGSEVFNEDWELLFGGKNYKYNYFVSDDPTDLYFNMLDETFGVVTVASHQTNGTFYIVSDIPHNTTDVDEIHVGTDWAMSTADFALLSSSQQAKYYDEAPWTSFDPLYEPNDDLMTITPRYDIEFYTNCPAFKFIFNTTGAVITLDDNVPAVVINNGAYTYVVFYEPLVFINGIQSIKFDILYPDDTIELSDVDFGMATVAKGASTPPSAFDKIADIAA